MLPVVIDLVNEDDADTDVKKRAAGSLYSQWCLHLLSENFTRVRMVDLRSALKYHMGKLIPAYMAIAEAHRQGVAKEQKLLPSIEIKKSRREKWLPYTGLKLMKVARDFGAETPSVRCPLFEKDLATLGNLTVISLEVDTIECGCCCSDVRFEEMVQCADGHLFCSTCLRRRVEESAFGSLPASGSLTCLDMAGCDKSIPWSEIKRVIPAELLLKYEQRQASDCVAQAKLQGLVYCPFCNFACDVDEGVYILKCPEKSCLKESCVKCKELSHAPLLCKEVEKPSDTRHRNQIEEIMSKSVLRQCTTCKAQLLKEDGCNKVTCRCGQVMCYVCRQPIKDYSHFCEHARDPGRKCYSCTKCSLWKQEDQNVVVLNAKKAAVVDVAKNDASILAREIGPRDALFAAKRTR